MENARTYAVPLGRLFLSVIFILAGFQKLQDPGGTAQYFAHVHIPIPDVTVWVSIIIELVGGLLLLVGYQTRWVALVLAIFCLITGFGVHLPVGDQNNITHFLKNLAMAGGFLYVFAYGAGKLSIDGPGK
jgi:putative oxidoreductase